jgi:hypothetical protein
MAAHASSERLRKAWNTDVGLVLGGNSSGGTVPSPKKNAGAKDNA